MRGLLAPILTCLLGLSLAPRSVLTASGSDLSGYSTSRISGYEVSDVNYVLDRETGANINRVHFYLQPVPLPEAEIRVKLNEGQWNDCAVEGASVRCPITPSLPVHDATSITVSAT